MDAPLRPLSISLLVLEEIGTLLRASDADIVGATWLDVETGVARTVSSTYGLDGEDGDEPDTRALTGWRAQEREEVRGYVAAPERYLRVPVGCDNGAGNRLGGFARSLPLGPMRDEVYDAIGGKGSFRRVKSILHRYGEVHRWDDYEAREDRDAARMWLQEEGYDAGPFEGE